MNSPSKTKNKTVERKLTNLRIQLRHEDVGRRRMAAQILQDSKAMARQAVPDIIQAVSDTDRLVRLSAVTSLGLLGSRSVTGIPALAKLLNDTAEDKLIRSRAANALGLIGRAALGTLIGAMNSKKVTVRYFAMFGLHRAVKALKTSQPIDSSAFPALIKELGAHDEDTRRLAASILAEIGESALPYLKEALNNRNIITRLNAASAILRMEPWHFCNQPTRSLYFRISRPTNIKLTENSAIATDVLRRGLEDRNPDVKYESLGHLGEIGIFAASAITQIMTALKCSEARIREQAAHVLGMIGTPAKKSSAALLICLRDENTRVRLNAAWALGRIGASTSLVRRSLEASLSDVHEEVRAMVRDSLSVLFQSP